MAFTDDFTGTDGQYLENRSGWARVDGVTGALQVNANNQLKCTSATSTAYQCTDQGSANHYVQATLVATDASFGQFVANRLSSNSAYIGFRQNGGKWQIYKQDSGFTLLAETSSPTPADGDVGNLESDSNDDHKLYINGSGTASLTASGESFNNTETRQGLVGRFGNENPLFGDFEAGTLSVPVAATVGTSSRLTTMRRRNKRR